MTKAPYIVNVNFNSPICLTESLVQVTAPNRRNSNVAQIQITYTTSNGTNVLGSNGKVLTLTSPDNNPTIIEPSLRCDVQGIQFTILKTTDKLSPSFVRLMVIGCYAPSNKNRKIVIHSFIFFFLVMTILPAAATTTTEAAAVTRKKFHSEKNEKTFFSVLARRTRTSTTGSFTATPCKLISNNLFYCFYILFSCF